MDNNITLRFLFIPLIFLFAFCQMCTSSSSSAMPNMDNQKRLVEQYGSRPGSYDLLVRVSNQFLDPGDRVQFGVFISGYGSIESANVFIMPSWSVFSIDNSTVALGHNPATPWDPLNTLVNIGNESFYDVNGYQISTEHNIIPLPGIKAPINLDLKINPEAKSGTYSMQFILKYYNGETWNTKPTSVNFTVRNFYQRHGTLVWLIGGIAATLTIISKLYSFFKWFGFNRARRDPITTACDGEKPLCEIGDRHHRRSKV